MAILEDHYKCSCGAKHMFSTWVYAHWDEKLVHVCDKCGRKHQLCQGGVIGDEERESNNF